jgi:FtsZ-interacting cell division protein ZipA
MNQSLLIVAGIIVIAAVIVAAILIQRRRRTERLRSQFGPEYDRAVEAKGQRGKAEAELAEREKRVKRLDIRPLSPAARRDFTQRWAEVQARFVDDPPRAVAFADALLAEVMSARGYPVKDFEQRAGDISVDHPRVVDHYRTAHDIAERHRRGEAGTEELRQAMIHYRALFDELVNEGVASAPRVEEVAH